MKPDPNDFIDYEPVFKEDDYDADEISFASFVIVPGGEVPQASLVYNADGIHFLGGEPWTDWGISLYYGHRFNGQTIPIGENEARHILDVLSDGDIEGFDWAAYDWVTFE